MNAGKQNHINWYEIFSDFKKDLTSCCQHRFLVALTFYILISKHQKSRQKRSTWLLMDSSPLAEENTIENQMTIASQNSVIARQANSLCSCSFRRLNENSLSNWSTKLCSHQPITWIDFQIYLELLINEWFQWI